MDTKKTTLLDRLLASVGLNLNPTTPAVGNEPLALTSRGQTVHDLNQPAIRSGLNRAQRRARAYGKGSHLTNAQRRAERALADAGIQV